MAELQKRTSPVNIAVMRKRALEGLIAAYIDPAIEGCREVLSGKPAVKTVMDALQSLKKVHADVFEYHRVKRLVNSSDGPSPLEAYRQSLPAWASLKVGKLCRQIHEGKRDSLFTGFLSHPPKGGIPGITWAAVLSQGPLEQELGPITKEWEAWHNQLRDWTQAPATSSGVKMEGGPGGQSPKTEEVTETPEQERMDTLRKEMGSLAQEIRSAYAGVVTQAHSAAAMRASIEASAVAKRVATGGAARLCYVYSIPCSWDAKRPGQNRSGRVFDRRIARPTPLWREDLEMFLSVVNPLVTTTTESVVAVLLGKCKRGGPVCWRRRVTA